MKNYRKEWEEKKPVCPECGGKLQGGSDAGNNVFCDYGTQCHGKV